MTSGYRIWDNPVAMPDLGDKKDGITLEEYFAGLDKQFGTEPETMCETKENVQSKQIGGSHYQKAIQPWDIIIEWELDYFEGNVLKYLLRWKFKDGVQDLKKAKHYLEKMIERNENGKQESK